MIVMETLRGILVWMLGMAGLIGLLAIPFFGILGRERRSAAQNDNKGRCVYDKR